ncbi:MAG: prolyl oligopeptidase family serine peptidase [Candidatus Desulfofervidaceae bacterium]|nr:prolyl oligopeptidase family serine peptidase [Candidatus Desulfofervidaceae bacterium]
MGKCLQQAYKGTNLFVCQGNKVKAIVLIHGGKASTERAKEMCEEYARYFYPEFTLISVDYHFSGYGGKELEDVVNAIDYAYYLSMTKVFLIGESHGGYLALLAATRKDINGVIDAYGPTDLLTMQTYATQGNPQLNVDWEDYIQATLQECNMRGLDIQSCIRQRSPYYLADRIQAPLLILHGTADEVVPFSQSKMLVERFEAIGKENYHFVSLNGYTHGFSLLEKKVLPIVKEFVEK